MKLAMIYTFWSGDDSEMLIDSINHHKNFVDEIFLSIQLISNKGGFSNLDDKLKSFLIENEIIKIEFSPDLNKSTKENERIKHNQAIDFLKIKGFTHFILSAADHFYKPKSFKNAIDKINEGYDVTLTRMLTYYKHKNWAIYPIEEYYMPFICELKQNTKYCVTQYPVICDPSTKVFPANKICIMDEKDALFDHYSMIRKDVEKKFKNAAASIRWTEKQINQFINEYKTAKLGDEIQYFNGRKIVDSKIINELYNY